MLASALLGQQQCAQPHTQRELKWASLPARPVRSGRRTGPQPVNSLAMGISSSSAAQIGVLSNVASATIVALGALWWVQQNRSETTDSDPECPTCEGTGYTDCICHRWNDGDVGCSSCGGTGKSVCPTCGGGGKGVPIYAKIVARDGSRL